METTRCVLGDMFLESKNARLVAASFNWARIHITVLQNTVPQGWYALTDFIFWIWKQKSVHRHTRPKTCTCRNQDLKDGPGRHGTLLVCGQRLPLTCSVSLTWWARDLRWARDFKSRWNSLTSSRASHQNIKGHPSPAPSGGWISGCCIHAFDEGQIGVAALQKKKIFKREPLK